MLTSALKMRLSITLSSYMSSRQVLTLPKLEISSLDSTSDSRKAFGIIWPRANVFWRPYPNRSYCGGRFDCSGSDCIKRSS